MPLVNKKMSEERAASPGAPRLKASLRRLTPPADEIMLSCRLTKSRVRRFFHDKRALYERRNMSKTLSGPSLLRVRTTWSSRATDAQRRTTTLLSGRSCCLSASRRAIEREPQRRFEFVFPCPSTGSPSERSGNACGARWAFWGAGRRVGGVLACGQFVRLQSGPAGGMALMQSRAWARPPAGIQHIVFIPRSMSLPSCRVKRERIGGYAWLRCL